MNKKTNKRRRSVASKLQIEDVVEPHPNNLRGVPLSKANPEVAAEWYYPKNCSFGPEDFSFGSAVIAWWKCPSGHIYNMRILHRSIRGSGCPYCQGKKVCKDNSLATTNPKVAKQWHPQKNGTLTPKDLVSGSHKKVWWLCPKGHSWKSVVKSRTLQDAGCPKCHDLRCLNLRDYPLLLNLLDKEKNEGLNIERLTVTTKIWWRCPKGPDHSWCQPVRKHRDTMICPFCTWRVVSVTNSLHRLYPELAREVHPTKNGNLTAKDISARTDKKIWWKCSVKPRHVWEASVYNRTANKSGCPKCWVEKRAGGYFKELAAKRRKSQS